MYTKGGGCTHSPSRAYALSLGRQCYCSCPDVNSMRIVPGSVINWLFLIIAVIGLSRETPEQRLLTDTPVIR